jgi:hypothetical protein
MASASFSSSSTLCRERIAKIERKTERIECVFANGSTILISPFLATQVSVGDEISFPLATQAVDAGTEIYVGRSAQTSGHRDLYQVSIGYVSQPRQNKREEYFVIAEVQNGQLGISSIRIGAETLRDYFYVADRQGNWERQRTFYQVLQASQSASPAELRLAFKLRDLELRASHAPKSEFRTLERAFNMLSQEELRACYAALLKDSLAPAVFPYGGFGSILVMGERSRNGDAFFTKRILAFLPEQRHRHFRAPLRRCDFYEGRALYRDLGRKLEVGLDPGVLPLVWDATWNQWKHLLAAKVELKAIFVRSGKYRRRRGQWELANCETALPSRVEVRLPADIHSQIGKAKSTFHRFGQYSDSLQQVRADTAKAPIEKKELQRICGTLGIPGDFDVAKITWQPDYDPFFYQQLSRRARTFYLFRDEYIFDLERGVVIETPELGHATYVFAKPDSMAVFLADYARTTKEDILDNRSNVAERLGYLGRVVHGANPRGWLNKIKAHVGEPPDFVQL